MSSTKKLTVPFLPTPPLHLPEEPKGYLYQAVHMMTEEKKAELHELFPKDRAISFTQEQVSEITMFFETNAMDLTHLRDHALSISLQENPTNPPQHFAIHYDFLIALEEAFAQVWQLFSQDSDLTEFQTFQQLLRGE